MPLDRATIADYWEGLSSRGDDRLLTYAPTLRRTKDHMAAPKITTYPGLLEALAKGGLRAAIAISRTGLPAAVLVSLAKHHGVSTQRVCRWFGITSATASREIRNQAMLSPAQTERLTRIARLENEAIEMLGSRSAALRWMETPSLALAGESPIEMTDTSFGFDAVRRVLSSIRYGGTA